MKKLSLVLRLVLATGAVVALAACGKSGATNGVPTVGQSAPSWSESTVLGSTLSSQSLSGKPMYLNFFASWCPPCNDEAPLLRAEDKKFAARGVEFVGVDILENSQKADGFAKKYGLQYPIVVDGGALRDAYKINGMPVSVFIKRDGTIANIIVGPMTKPVFESQLKALL